MKKRLRPGLVAIASASVVVVPTISLAAIAAPAALASQSAPPATSIPASGSGPGQNASAVVAPSWQTNDIVWALASANGVVYVGGQFTSVRPPGDPAGTGEVARTYLAAFSASTGDLIMSFHPVLDGKVTALAMSPDGSTLYAGGSFTQVNGAFHGYAVALSAATGATVSSWAPHAGGPVLSIAPSPNGSEIYLGGDFTMLGGVARNRVGAVTAASGALEPWAPVVNGSVTSVAVAPDDSRVLIGGYFTSFNGVTQQAIGSTNPVDGSSEPWALPSNFIPNNSNCVSDVKDIVISGSTAYIANEGTGGGCFDGDFAVDVSSGRLAWQNDCLGATQSLVVLNGWLYKGSHAHDCAFSPGGFPAVRNAAGDFVVHRLLTQSLVDGSIGHWTPNTNGNNLGPRVMATDGTQLFLGGDFTTVNNKGQQGFARFTPTPDATSPTRPGQPVVTSTSAGVDSVSFTGSSDPDDGTLTYRIYRDGSTTVLATLTATSWPWALPVLRYRDSGLTAGSTHSYSVTASDGVHTSTRSLASAPVTVSANNPSLSYTQRVLGSHPSFLWTLGESSGTVAHDSTPNGFDGIYEPGTTKGQPGPITGTSQTATGFDGRTGLVTAASAVTGPQVFSIEAWFKTGTNTGGKLVGFGNAQTGMSSKYDRQIYMMNDGQLSFGVFSNNAVHVIETPRVYNDGRWHYVVGTLGASGMSFYVDGRLAGTDTATSAQAISGYWRVGGDNLFGFWDLDNFRQNSQGTTQPYDYYFTGTIGDVAVYPVALTSTQVATHYAANSLEH